MAGYKLIQVDKQDGIGRLTLARPPLNVITIEMMGEMAEALDKFIQDSRLKVVVISGKGKSFCAGVDVADHTEDKVGLMIDSFHALFKRLTMLEAVTLASVRGHVLGGGCELAVFCDLIVASETAKFGQPEIKVGVFPPVSAVVLPRVISEKRAAEILFTGDPIDAGEAHRLGLVNQVVPDGELEAATKEWESRIGGLSSAVLRLTKRSMLLARGLEFPAALKRVEDIYLNSLMKTEDAREGLAAFMEKRKPAWRER